jgi:hypothetical protein
MRLAVTTDFGLIKGEVMTEQGKRKKGRTEGPMGSMNENREGT